MIGRHVSAEEIARFSEGDVSRRRAARISSHLARCSRCARVREDLAMVPTLLARTAAPPMPDHLTARIQTALMTESARRATPAADPGRAQPQRRAAGGSWPRIPGMSARAAGWLAAAAAAVVVAGGGTYLVIANQGSSGAHSGSVLAGPAARSAAGAQVPVAPALRGVGPRLEYQRDGKRTAFSPVVTGTNYLPAKLASQVQGTLTDTRRPAAAPGAAGPSAGKTVPHATPGFTTGQGSGPSRIGAFTPSALQGCVSRISAGALVLLVDVADYQGSPAAVIVTELAPKGPEQVSVVGPGCSASRSDLLTRTTLPASG